VQTAACKEIAGLGMDPLEVMSAAYTSESDIIHQHDEKVRELERRRREVKRDLDALQRSRPTDGETIEG